MPSRKSTEQCMTWLRSKAADRDSLDGINAELVLNIIDEQKVRLDKLGIQFQQMKNSRDKLAHQIGDFVDNDLRLTESQRAFLEENGVELSDF